MQDALIWIGKNMRKYLLFLINYAKIAKDFEMLKAMNVQIVSVFLILV